MSEVELIEALPGAGSIAAFIVMVILFLCHQEKIDCRVDATIKMFCDQIRDFVSGVVEVSQETTAAIKGLEDAVRELRRQIKGK